MADPIYELTPAAITATVKVSGVLTNATTATFSVKAANESTYTDYVYGVDSEVTRPFTGTYVCTVPTTVGSAGTWRWHLVTTGTAAGSGGGSFGVNPLP